MSFMISMLTNFVGGPEGKREELLSVGFRPGGDADAKMAAYLDPVWMHRTFFVTTALACNGNHPLARSAL
jgi:hypothetical protein